MDGTLKPLNLLNIAGGSLVEKFNREFGRVIENIKDINTSETDLREITIKLSFKPYEDRSGAEIKVNANSKLAGGPKIKSRMAIQKRNGSFQAFELQDHPELFEEETENS